MSEELSKTDLERSPAGSNNLLGSGLLGNSLAGSSNLAASSRSPIWRVQGPPKKSMASRLWDLLQPLARLWGVITAIVMTGAGAELLVLGYEAAPVVMLLIAVCMIHSLSATIMLTLETMWVAALFVDLLCRRGEYSLPLRCWDFTRWSCSRVRAPLYACGATALLFSHLTLLVTISGGMLLILAALRAAVPFSPYANHGPQSPRAGSSLLSQNDMPMPDVFYNATHSAEDVNERPEEMKILEIRTPGSSRSVSPRPPLLEL